MIIVAAKVRRVTPSCHWHGFTLRGRAEILLLAAVLAWSLNFAITKYAIGRFSPLAYTAPRYVLAGLAFSLVALHREGSVRVRRHDARLVLTAAVVGIWVNQLAYTYALRLAGAATVSLLFGTAPILVAVFAHVSRVESLGVWSWLATALSSLGVAILVVGSGGSLSGNLGGILLCLVSSATFAFYSVAVVPLTRRYSPLRLSAVLTLAGSVPLLASGLLQLWHQDWASIGTIGWLAFLYGLLPGYVLSNLIWFHALSILGPARAALYINLEPFLGALFAVLLLSEHIGGFRALGGALTAAALFLLPRRARR